MFLFLQNLSTKRTPWLLLALSALLLDLCALYFQHVMKLDPCVMCVYERLAVIGIVFAGLLGAIKPENLLIRLSGFLLWGVSAVWGLMLAVEHVDIQTNASPFSTCDFLPNFPEWAPLHHWIPWLFNPTGDCTDIVWTMFNYSMPQWLIFGFAVYCTTFAVIAITALLPKEK